MINLSKPVITQTDSSGRVNSGEMQGSYAAPRIATATGLHTLCTHLVPEIGSRTHVYGFIVFRRFQGKVWVILGLF